MKDIQVICDCGNFMMKIEDGRLESTLAHNRRYPKQAMEFVCPDCNKAIDLAWEDAKLYVDEPIPKPRC